MTLRVRRRRRRTRRRWRSRWPGRRCRCRARWRAPRWSSTRCLSRMEAREKGYGKAGDDVLARGEHDRGGPVREDQTETRRCANGDVVTRCQEGRNPLPSGGDAADNGRDAALEYRVFHHHLASLSRFATDHLFRQPVRAVETALPADIRSKHFGNSQRATGSNSLLRFLDKTHMVFAVFTTMALLPSFI